MDDDDAPRALGARIREHRTERGLSIRAAAKEAGISEGSWRHLESGYPRKDGTVRWIAPTLDTLHRISFAIGIDVRELRKLAGDHITLPTRDETIRAAATKTLDVSDLSDEDVAMLEQYANRLRRGPNG